MMGVMHLVLLWVVSAYVILITVPPVCGQEQGGGYTLCQVPGCNCTKRVETAVWKVVNCTLDSTQDVQLSFGSIPEEIIEIFIVGGRWLNLESKSFYSLPALQIFHADGIKSIDMATQSFYNITSPSLLIQIENCDRLIVKTVAFDVSAKTSVKAEFRRVTFLSMEKATFGKLQQGIFEQIANLQLAERTFDFTHHTLENEAHGPVTSITFSGSVIPEIPSLTFCSALNSVNITNSRIGLIHPSAFKASEIDTVSLINTSIEDVMGDAFNSQTLIIIFTISRCKITNIHSGAIMGGISKLNIEHSKIKNIETNAVNITSANIKIVDNEIVNFGTSGFVLNNWNEIIFEQNYIFILRSHFLVVSPSLEDNVAFYFIDNDVQLSEQNALSFMAQLDVGLLTLNENFFNETCRCAMEDRMIELTNDTKHTTYLVETSFCNIAQEVLARCYELEQGLINMHNFTELVCNSSDKLKCVKYLGETKHVNVTGKMFSEDENSNKTSWLILIITVIGLAILAIVATFAFLLLKGGRWLKRNGYFRNIHYNQNERSTEEENTIVTIDENEPLDVPELSLELLQQLRKRLDDPNTKEEATEMIERLYEMFIVEDNYENNNRQDEEAHLYEELGNLQQQQNYQQEQDHQDTDKLQNCDGAMSILRLMEEKFNLQPGEGEDNIRPALVGDYAEPSDAAVHLYSELQQTKDISDKDNKSTKDSLKSSGSGKMTFRPLPEKPPENSEAGPSSK